LDHRIEVRAHLDAVVKGEHPPKLTDKIRALAKGFKARIASALHKVKPEERAQHIEALVQACAQTARLLQERLKVIAGTVKQVAGTPGVEPGPGRADAFG